jgi:hypothetical protein
MMRAMARKQKQRRDTLNTASVIYKETEERLHGKKDERQAPYQKKRRN